ncbi:MAG: DUF2809 domain-containing protein [Bacteroidales bacterium]|nr:DUF2809 domain-containing protein [Bacteroidales bacterium]
MKRILTKRNITLFIILIIITILGFVSKLYKGPLEQTINDKLAGLFYVVFWSLLTGLFISKKEIKIVTVVLVITILLEFFQLYSNPFLAIIRSSYLGRAIIGSQFSWLDFPFYTTGAFISLLILIKVDNFNRE